MTPAQIGTMLIGGRTLPVYEDSSGRRVVLPTGTWESAIPVDSLVGSQIQANPDPGAALGRFQGTIGFSPLTGESYNDALGRIVGELRQAPDANEPSAPQGYVQLGGGPLTNQGNKVWDDNLGWITPSTNVMPWPDTSSGLGKLAFGSLLGGLGALGPLASLFGGAGGATGAGMAGAGGGGAAEIASLAGLEGFGGVGELGAALGGAGGTGGLGAVGDPFIDAFTPVGTGGGPTGMARASGGGGLETQARKSALTSLLKDQFGIDVSPGTLDMIGKLLGTGLGMYGANQQQNALERLSSDWLNLGAPYRASLAALEANPAGYYQSPEVQGALDQGTNTLARSLSAKVGNPILNPTALQEMQNYTTQGLLNQLNNRRNFLMQAGQLGIGPSAQFSGQAAMNEGQGLNALGAGIQSVLGQDPYEKMRQVLGDILRQSPQGALSLA